MTAFRDENAFFDPIFSRLQHFPRWLLRSGPIVVWVLFVLLKNIFEAFDKEANIYVNANLFLSRFILSRFPAGFFYALEALVCTYSLLLETYFAVDFYKVPLHIDALTCGVIAHFKAVVARTELSA